MRVLVIDDEPPIRRALRAGLERSGHKVLLAGTAEEGLDLAAEHPPDLIILDLALPDKDGMQVCRELREWSKVPIIILSVRGQDQDKAAALDAGADDYLTKPFSQVELQARMRAVMRRFGNDPEPEVPQVTLGDLHVDFVHRRVTEGGRTIRLTPIEYDLLRYMVLHPNRVLTHRQLLTQVWGVEYAEDINTLRAHLSHLRTKIEPNPPRPRYIHTEPRVGYRFGLEE